MQDRPYRDCGWFRDSNGQEALPKRLSNEGKHLPIVKHDIHADADANADTDAGNDNHQYGDFAKPEGRSRHRG